MQCSALPAKVLTNVDKLSRKFLWGSSKNKKKLHLVGSSKITKPKKEGGLGIQAAKAKSIALLAKLNWRLATEPNSLWAKVLTQKYRTPSRISNPCIPFRTYLSRGQPFERESWYLREGQNGLLREKAICLYRMINGWTRAR